MTVNDLRRRVGGGLQFLAQIKDELRKRDALAEVSLNRYH